MHIPVLGLLDLLPLQRATKVVGSTLTRGTAFPAPSLSIEGCSIGSEAGLFLCLLRLCEVVCNLGLRSAVSIQLKIFSTSCDGRRSTTGHWSTRICSWRWCAGPGSCIMATDAFPLTNQIRGWVGGGWPALSTWILLCWHKDLEGAFCNVYTIPYSVVILHYLH